jgi:polyphosphate kinase
VFNYLTGYSKQESYRKFLLAPVNLRQKLMMFIEREAELGGRGRILIKANHLVDEQLIRALYRASQAGAKVDLIIRGICCLRPGLPGISENISVISIVGRFLEHSRIFYFHNDGEPELYVGSADLMPRNIDRRVETVFPIEDSELRQQVVENILEVCLKDTEKGHILGADGRYIPRLSVLDEAENPFNSQAWLLNGRMSSVHPPHLPEQ